MIGSRAGFKKQTTGFGCFSIVVRGFFEASEFPDLFLSMSVSAQLEGQCVEQGQGKTLTEGMGSWST